MRTVQSFIDHTICWNFHCHLLSQHLCCTAHDVRWFGTHRINQSLGTMNWFQSVLNRRTKMFVKYVLTMFVKIVWFFCLKLWISLYQRSEGEWMISEMNWGHFYTKDLVQKRSTSLFSVAVVVTFHISDELFAQKTINGLLVRRNIFFSLLAYGKYMHV